MDIPKLVDPLKFQVPEKISLPKKKLNLNKILLIGFIIFSIFFLYNCKYGIFKYNQDNLYTLTN